MSTDGQVYGVETLSKISIVWVGCTNVTDDRRQTTDGPTMTYSEHELEFTFAKNADDLQLIFGRTASAVRPSDKSSINTNRKSTTRFPMPKMNIMLPSAQRGSKRKMAVSRIKFHFTWRKYATKFLSVNTYTVSCPIYPRKNGSRETSTRLLRENLPETDPPTPSKMPIFNRFSLVAPQP